MPVEVMAGRGIDTLRFGPLKPVGLTNPKTGKRPYAVVQLRQENSASTMYNMVGFQTNLKFPEQKRVFSMIPGLENADFIRYGVMHRNTYIDSPRILDINLSVKKNIIETGNRIFFAGQITGVEGYMESASTGIIAAINAINEIEGKDSLVLPNTTMIGALIKYITDETVTNFQPMGANFGIIGGLDTHIKNKKDRYEAFAKRSVEVYNMGLSGGNI
jgi:methylenetetrahydrofolate--tRNA-(uracil-5-)-methyltransferase